VLKSRDSHSSLELLSGVILISFSAVFVKLAHVGPSAAAFYRMAFGGALLLLIALSTHTRLWAGWRPFGLAVLSGVLFAGDLIFWHRSIHFVGPGLATILANFQVFFVTAVAILILKERPKWRSLAAVPLALIGLFLLVGTHWSQLDEQYHLGVIFGFITALFYASFVLTLRKLQSLPDPPTPFANITISTLTTALVTGLVTLATGESFAIPDIPSALWLVLYGFCGQVLGWVLITRSIKHMPAARVSLTLLLQPTLSFIWDVLFFHRQTSGIEFLGAMVAIVAIYLGTWQGEPKIEARQV
jgi:drug/metabolite transporter (DMT)-like permease